MPKTAIDPFFALAQDLNAPPRRGVMITPTGAIAGTIAPSDTQDLAYVTKLLLVTIGVGGTGFNILLPDDIDSNPYFIALGPGSYQIPLQIRRVLQLAASANPTNLGTGGQIFALWGG